MSRLPASLAVAGLAVTAVAVVALAAGPLRPGPAHAAQPSPSAPVSPSAAPSVSAPPAKPDPTPVPTPVPTQAPTQSPIIDPNDGGEDAMPITVDLDTADQHDVSIDIVDRTGSISLASSGRPLEGMSVDFDALAVENVDGHTLRLTWTDFAMDNRLALFVDEVGGRLQLILVRPEPTQPVDAIGGDRVLVLVFDRDVEAASVRTFVQSELDTAA